MADIYRNFGTLITPTLTLTGLANNTYRQSTAIDLSSVTNPKIIDLHCQLAFSLATGSLADDKSIYVFCVGSYDGTVYPDGGVNAITGTDGALTATDIQLGAPVQVVTLATNPAADPTTFISDVFSIASRFGGQIPKKIVFVVYNYLGLALKSADATNNYIKAFPVYLTSA